MSGPNRQIRAIVVDDEKLARKYLTEMLGDHPEISVVAECANGFEAVKAVAAHKPELMFLDIQMPKLDGFEVLELLDDQPAVVFVTAYDQYALKAFDAHALVLILGIWITLVGVYAFLQSLRQYPLDTNIDLNQETRQGGASNAS